MKEQNEPKVFGTGNHITNYTENHFHGSITAENFYACWMPEKNNQSKRENGRNPESCPNEPISEDIIPDDLWQTYSQLPPNEKLICLCIVYVQQVTDGDGYLFRFDNDWWALYSPIVYDKKLGLQAKPDVFYRLMEEIGMGRFRVNCTRDRMMEINGVFLKPFKDWKPEDYYGERSWTFFHKKKIGLLATDTLNLLHEQMSID